MKLKKQLLFTFLMIMELFCYSQNSFESCSFPNKGLNELILHFDKDYDVHNRDSLRIINLVDSLISTNPKIDEQFHLLFVRSRLLNSTSATLEAENRLIYNNEYNTYCIHLFKTFDNYLFKLNKQRNITEVSNVISVLEELNKSKYSDKINYQIASSYYFLEQYELAVIYFMSISSFTKETDFGYLASLNNNIALTYQQLGHIEQAQKYFKKALELWKKHKGNPNVEKKYYEYFTKVLENNIVELGINVENSDSTIYLELINQRELAISNGIESSLKDSISIYISLADFAGRNKKFEEAEKYLSIVEDLFNSDTLDKIDMNAQILFRQLKFRQSLYYQNQKRNLNHFLEIEKHIRQYNNEKIIELKKTSASDIEHKINLIHKKERTIIEKQHANQILIGVIIISFICILFFIITFKIRKSAYKEISEQNVVLEKSLDNSKFLLKEINHRVKNNLQLMSSVAIIEYSKNPQQFNLRNFEKKIYSISIMHDLLYKSDDYTLIELKDYTEQLFYHIKASTKTPFESQLSIMDSIISIDDAINLGLLINELISNTIKHCKTKDNRMIQISFSMNYQGDWILRYKDNGITFDQNKSNSSFGSIMLKLLTQNLRGTYQISTEDGYQFDATLKLNQPNKNTLS